MALLKEKPTHYGSGITANYHRIETTRTQKTPNGYITHIEVQSYENESAAKEEDASPLAYQNFSFEEMPCTLDATYLMLKSLIEFEGAVDC